MKQPTAPQQDVMLHPDRMRIVGEFALRDGLTPAELHDHLPDLSTATLYRHLAKLVEERVLAVREVHAKRGTTERTYALAVNLALSMSVLERTPKRLLSVVGVAAAVLFRAFTHFIETGDLRMRSADPVLRFYPLYATDDEFRALGAKIERLIVAAARAGGRSPEERRGRLFFLAAIPESTWPSKPKR
jgi:helix-turn-helix protein